MEISKDAFDKVFLTDKINAAEGVVAPKPPLNHKRSKDSIMAQNTHRILASINQDECPIKLLRYIGCRFGRLMVVRYAGSTKKNGWVNARFFECRCDCGNVKYIRPSHLGEYANSCGCLHAERTAMACTVHANSINRKPTPTYNSWASMIQRCQNPNCKKYAIYGGRGITVCERWNDFANFLADMGYRPKGTTIGRIDNDGNYEPRNCRWETPDQQSNNRRTNVYVVFDGKTMTVTQLEDKLRLRRDVLASHLRMGKTLERALGSIKALQHA